MSRKALLLFSQEPEIKAKMDEMKALEKATKERYGFIKKSMDDLEKWTKDEAKKHWAEVQDLLVAKGYLPNGYKAGRDNLHADFDAGVLFHEIRDGSEDTSIKDIKDLLLSLLR